MEWWVSRGCADEAVVTVESGDAVSAFFELAEISDYKDVDRHDIIINEYKRYGSDSRGILIYVRTFE